MEITLTVTAGPHQGQVFSFAEHDTFVVGRSVRARFRLKDRYFSRFHFLIEVNPPHCRLIDMDSRNGTSVNGQKVKSIDLQDGDEIKAGHTFLRVALLDTESLPPTIEVVPPAPLALQTLRETPPPTQPISAARSCLMCAAPVSTGWGLPLCATCQEHSGTLPQPIPGYRIVRELGRGGMGVVYQAVCEGKAGLVALKTLLPAVAGSRTQVQRFLREAETLRELEHPNVVAFRAMGEANGLLYFVMDYVKGTDAATMLKKLGPLPVGLSVELVCQMLAALGYAHARGIVHRDLKPANLLATKQDGRPWARLADFGLARKYQASQLSGLTLAGGLGGTVAFMPPEQVLDFRNVQPAADQYSAAATLYNLLSGAHVHDFPANFHQQLLRILQEEPVPLQRRRDLPAGLVEAIHRALAREPAERFPDVLAFRDALSPFAS